MPAKVRCVKAQRACSERSKTYKPRFLHADIKYLPWMPDERRRKYLFVAIDRTTHWVYLEIRASKSATSAAGFLANLIQKAPFKINIILTDNGKGFTDRFCGPGERKPTQRATILLI